MVFAIIIGAILGLSGLNVAEALTLLATVLVSKLLVDLKWDRIPLLGWPSPYVTYRYNLSRAGEPIAHAWISYALQLFIFGMLFGSAAYMLVRYSVR